MKLTNLILALICCASFANAQTEQEGLNRSEEFFVVKNDAKKTVIITDVFGIVLPDGVSMTSKNEDVKKNLTEQLVLSTLIKQEEVAAWNFKATVTDSQGELFDDAAAAGRYRTKVIAEWKKKGYKVEEYPYTYKP